MPKNGENDFRKREKPSDFTIFIHLICERGPSGVQKEPFREAKGPLSEPDLGTFWRHFRCFSMFFEAFGNTYISYLFDAQVFM